MGARLQPAEPKILEANDYRFMHMRQQIKSSRRATNHNVSSGIFICIYLSLDLHVIRLSLCCDKVSPTTTQLFALPSAKL
jgi:hypothetical protein